MVPLETISLHYRGLLFYYVYSRTYKLPQIPPNATFSLAIASAT